MWGSKVGVEYLSPRSLIVCSKDEKLHWMRITPSSFMNELKKTACKKK
jgi:hypothetical protein